MSIIGCYLSLIAVNPQMILDLGFLRGNFIDNILWGSDSSEYKRDYDVNLYVMTLCNLLKNFYNSPEIGLKLHILLQSMINVLHNKYQIDSDR